VPILRFSCAGWRGGAGAGPFCPDIGNGVAQLLARLGNHFFDRVPYEGLPRNQRLRQWARIGQITHPAASSGALSETALRPPHTLSSALDGVGERKLSPLMTDFYPQLTSLPWAGNAALLGYPAVERPSTRVDGATTRPYRSVAPTSSQPHVSDKEVIRCAGSIVKSIDAAFCAVP
jgi:hypothetical protein